MTRRVWAAASYALIGAVGVLVFAGDPSPTFVAVAPTGTLIAWALLCILSGVLGITGSITRIHELEMLALGGAGVVTLAWTIAVINAASTAGRSVWTAALISAAFVCLAIQRIVDLQSNDRAVRELGEP